LSGITFTIDKNNHPKKILVQGNPVEKRKSVGTNDYLANGGDNMSFSKGIQTYDLNYVGIF
jgi:hypothetical protein